MNKKKEVLSEAIMLAYEYSKDSKKILSSFEQAIRFETTGTQRLILCPYSDAVYACKSQSIENNVELQSYFDNLDTPQRESTRENLHDSFNEVYNELKDNVTAKKKTLYFIVSSQYETFTYSPYQYMSSHIAGIKIHFVALESMRDKLEPFVKSNLLNTDATYVKAKSLIDSTYSQERTTEVVCDILTVISEISPEIKISDSLYYNFRLFARVVEEKGKKQSEIFIIVIFFVKKTENQLTNRLI